MVPNDSRSDLPVALELFYIVSLRRTLRLTIRHTFNTGCPSANIDSFERIEKSEIITFVTNK